MPGEHRAFSLHSRRRTMVNAMSPIRTAIAVILLALLGTSACLAATPAFAGEVCSFASTSTNKPPGACSLTGNVPVGATVVVLAAEDGTDYHVANVTDTRGNTYSQALYYHNTNYQPTEQSIWYAYVTHPLTSSDSVTLTWSAPTTEWRSYAVNVAYLTGVAQSGQPDSTAKNNDYMNSGLVSIRGRTVALRSLWSGFTAANDFAWKIGPGWTIYRSENVNIYYHFFYKVLSSAAATDPGGTGPPASTYSGVWAAFKAAE